MSEDRKIKIRELKKKYKKEREELIKELKKDYQTKLRNQLDTIGHYTIREMSKRYNIDGDFLRKEIKAGRLTAVIINRIDNARLQIHIPKRSAEEYVNTYRDILKRYPQHINTQNRQG